MQLFSQPLIVGSMKLSALRGGINAEVHNASSSQEHINDEVLTDVHITYMFIYHSKKCSTIMFTTKKKRFYRATY
jgi:hypothetical protein